MTRRVRFDVSGELIVAALALPDGTTLYNIVPHDGRPDVFAFYVEHPDLPELSAGDQPPEISPRLTADYDRRPATWIEFDWNLPKSKD